MQSSETTHRDERFMAQAIELARRAQGRTHPNPLVGSIIVRDDHVVGRGYHVQAGSDHAEIAAIKDADADLEGCELFVNHEPCCHFGRTPPCTDAILKAGIRRVVVGTIDPDPRVSGRGVEILRQAGVEVTCGVLEEQSRQLNAPFFKYISQKLPWVSAKWAMSLDGKIATRTGDSRWITDDASRRRVHQLRNTHDAILVGTKTLLTDDPRLTCRCEDGRDPVRFVVDAQLRAPLDHRVFNHGDSDAATIVFASGDAPAGRRKELKARGVDIVNIATDDRGWLRGREMLEAIYDRQLLSVLVEGGGTLLGSLFDEGLVDYAYAFVAPRIIGGDKAPTALAGRGIESMTQCLDLRDPQIERFDGDVLIHGGIGDAPSPVDAGDERHDMEP